MDLRDIVRSPWLVVLITVGLATAAGASDLIPALPATATDTHLIHAGTEHPLYPATTTACPDLPSPFALPEGREFVVIQLADGTFGLAEVTLTDHDRQCDLDTHDFPTLATTGLHDPARLATITSITGRPLAEIDSLAAPGALSSDGFVAADESVRSVLMGDDALVRAMGLTHADLARPLFHVWNLMQTDLALDRWSMRDHQWRNVRAVKYHGGWVALDAHDTKGGQQSPFADGLEGGFWMVFQRALAPTEEEFLRVAYDHAGPSNWDRMHGTLSRLWLGEMEAYYIQWYGFYEGHTDWRADPVGIARIFGLRTLDQLEAAFPGRLHEATSRHHVATGVAEQM